MFNKELALVGAIAAAHPGNELAVIEMVIAASDTPITVRSLSRCGCIANAAYYDLMEKTHRQFTTESIVTAFPPQDLHSGHVKRWMDRYWSQVRTGCVFLPVRLQAGKDVASVNVQGVCVAGWVVTGVNLRLGQPRLRLVQNQASRQYVGRAHTMKPPDR